MARNLPVLMICLSLLAVASSFVAGVDVAYRLSALLSVVLMAFVLIKVGFRRYLLRSVPVVWFYFVCIFGSVFGILNVFLRDNSLQQYLVYTGLYWGEAFALSVGVIFFRGLATEKGADVDVAKEATRWLGLLAVYDFLWLVVRVLVVGLDVRTSYGFSFLSPFFALYLSRYVFKSSVMSVAALLFVATIVLFTGVLSGLRSVSAFSVILVLLLLYRAGVERLIGVAIVAIIAISFIGVLRATDLVGDIQFGRQFDRSVEIIINRFNTSLLSDEGVKVDPGEGRSDEAQMAMDEFFGANHLSVDNIFGRGFGFSFIDNSKDGELTAHVHMTPVAYWVRNGVVGFAFYVFTLMLAVYVFLEALVRRLPSYIFLMRSIFLVWSAGSLFAGLLLSPVYWLLYGAVVSSRLFGARGAD